MKFENYSDLAIEFELAVEKLAAERGFEFCKGGASQQSMSSYFSLAQEREMDGEPESRLLAVRISDHAHFSRASEVDFHVGVNSDHGAIGLSAKERWFDYDEDGNMVFVDEAVDQDFCDGIEVPQDEFDAAVAAVIAAAEAAEWE